MLTNILSEYYKTTTLPNVASLIAPGMCADLFILPLIDRKFVQATLSVLFSLLVFSYIHTSHRFSSKHAQKRTFIRKTRK